MSKVFFDKNPANIYDADLTKILAVSPHMLEALKDCPEIEQQALFDSFNQLMWQMIDSGLKAVKETADRRALREVQVNGKSYVPMKQVEIKAGSSPNIEYKNGKVTAEVETPNGKEIIEFKAKS